MNETDRPQRKRKQKPIRFKFIRPIYETLTVNDQNAKYQDAHFLYSRDVIRLLDHVVIGDGRHYSYADSGLL